MATARLMYRFDPDRPLKATREFTFEGQKIAQGDEFPSDAPFSVKFRLYRARYLVYGDWDERLLLKQPSHIKRLVAAASKPKEVEDEPKNDHNEGPEQGSSGGDARTPRTIGRPAKRSKSR